MARKAAIGQGTIVKVAPIGRDRIHPEPTTFTVGSDAAVNATSLTISMDPAITRVIPASASKPLFLNFLQEDGTEHFVTVTANISPTATTLTVTALKKAIPADATAVFPVILSQRENANLTDQDTEFDVNVFDGKGFKDSGTGLLGNGLELNGFYDPLDAGFRTCKQARFRKSEIYVEVELSPPSPEYARGEIYKFFSGVKVPLEIPAGEAVKANISLMSRGEITNIDPT